MVTFLQLAHFCMKVLPSTEISPPHFTESRQWSSLTNGLKSELLLMFILLLSSYCKALFRTCPVQYRFWLSKATLSNLMLILTFNKQTKFHHWSTETIDWFSTATGFIEDMWNHFPVACSKIFKLFKRKIRKFYFDSPLWIWIVEK